MDEGMQLLMNISKYDDIVKGKTDNDGGFKPPKVIKRTESEKELDRMRLEMAKMIATSYGVIDQAKTILDGIDNVEDYIKSDAKVAITLHNRNIERLSRILAGLPAFENEDHLTLDLDDVNVQLIKKRMEKGC